MTRALPCAVELHDLTKSFGDVLAVDEVSAVALPGEVTALLGPNGAGKTLRPCPEPQVPETVPLGSTSDLK